MPPAARVTDNHTCPLVHPDTGAHVGGPVLPPCSPEVRINGLHAARVGDKAFCKDPPDVPPDTIRGGTIAVFIQGSPASRMGDSTDVGSVVMGSPNVFIGNWTGGPLTPSQAQWLYDYLAAEESIPYEYAANGCYARADRMADHIAALGIDVKKQFVYRTPTSGPLFVPIANYPGGGVTWRYHVAPVVKVINGGNVISMVIDPSLGSGGPLTVDQWIGHQTSDPSAVEKAITNKNVYYRDRTGETEIMSDPSKTNADLENFRNERANLPASSGRNIPNAPVHY